MFDIVHKADNFYDFLYVFCISRPFWKGVCKNKKKGKNGSKFFRFRVDPFSWRDKNNFDKVSFPSMCIHTPLSIIWCATHDNGPYTICGQCRFRSACASVQSDLSIICSLIYTIVSTDSVSGQWRPLSIPVWRKGRPFSCVVQQI